MKKLFIVLFTISSLTSNYPQQFHSLDGIEDQQGNTLLLYRLGDQFYFFNPVYKLNTQSLSETLLMQAFYINYPSGEIAKAIWDFEFFPNDESNFMNVGYEINPDNHAYIARNDTIMSSGFEGYWKVDISKQNQLKVFVFGGGGEVRSWDGGYTFPEDSIPAVTNFIPIALADFDDNVIFGFNEDLQLTKNGEVVDTSLIIFDQYSKFLYDVNQFHVYRVNKTYGGYCLNISNNRGNANTWEQRFYPSEQPVFMTIDSEESGEIYYAEGGLIFKSVNNGYAFSLYKTLPSKLVGIYKKPNSEILYAASSRKIYKITPDSTVVIKSLPLPIELFQYYPLSIGNYWIYKVADWSYPYYEEDTFTRSILSKEMLSNNKEYFKIEEKYYNPVYARHVYERIDTMKGMVYRFDDQCSNPDSEIVIDNFNAEVGDSILNQRFTFCWDSILTYFSEEMTEPVFNEEREIRKFDYNWLEGHSHSLAKGLGIFNIGYGYDFGYTTYSLNGCVIDGNVYGDTTLTDVNDEQNPNPTEFKLEQNYPNPFNPSTVISYKLPVGGNVSLKVFDVLGREVATLVDEYRDAGSHNIEFGIESLELSSGIYFYQLKAGEFVDTKKMILAK